jgi:phosphopantothenoylcysteine decarboxylase/phosphopantothenate--cysteine ligase
MTNQRVLISAGGTREPLDPVRYLGNRSSGAMGIALAHEAFVRGASVTLVAAHLEIEPPSGIHVVNVGTALEMRAEMNSRAANSDVVIMAAAVADYRPEVLGESKLKKANLGATPSISLVQNPDILAELGTAKHSYKLIGFAAETENDVDKLVLLASEKLVAKKCDAIVVNSVGVEKGFGSGTTTVHVVGSSGRIIESATGSKASVARAILNAIS